MLTSSATSSGIRTPEQQRAWREKMGLISIIMTLMAGVGFLTFGFTEAVCGVPPTRFHGGEIQNGSVIIHGYGYDFANFKHPRVGPFDGEENPVFNSTWDLAGNDASFLFQTTNQKCLGIITKSSGSTITGSGEQLDWYFPCNSYNQHGTSEVNFSGYDSAMNCHADTTARQGLADMKRDGQVFYTWDDVRNTDRNLAVYESFVSTAFYRYHHLMTAYHQLGSRLELAELVESDASAIPSHFR